MKEKDILLDKIIFDPTINNDFQIKQQITFDNEGNVEKIKTIKVTSRNKEIKFKTII